jgi:hypothetical protein
VAPGNVKVGAAGTNRIKTCEEIVSGAGRVVDTGGTSVTLLGVHAIQARLLELPAGEGLIWLGPNDFAGGDCGLAMPPHTKTLIAVADDCPVTCSSTPLPRGSKPTVAVIQHDLLAKQPYRHSQEDVIFESWLRRQPGPPPRSAKQRAKLRDELFGKPPPCLRSSPLPKKYGWGLLFDEKGRVALCPMESTEYKRIVEGKTKGVAVLKALRSRRA